MTLGILYVIAMFAIVVPAMFFSVQARVVACAWVPGCLFATGFGDWYAWDATVSNWIYVNAAVDMAVDIVAFAVAMRFFVSCSDAMTASLFAPMALLNMAWAIGGVETEAAWTTLTLLGLLQIAFVPMTVNWEKAKRAFKVASVWSQGS